MKSCRFLACLGVVGISDALDQTPLDGDVLEFR